MEKRVLEVTIQGKAFKLRTTEDEPALREIVDFVNRRLDDVAASGAVTPHNAALLTLLTVTEELFRERVALSAIKERIRLKSSLILDMLDGVGPADAGDNPPAGGMSI